CQQGQSYPFTF
nr:immunoglobulin light chain junction region [Mus musculus]NSL99966.1 immunoglobulin light chain junction region [Mus musculus]NSM00048.1 immunoglobulin light chain junction region [Mus musculus]NSM00619.1 immunoglobulin light chain junction region [Mus musculus]NSM02895.1 immunoglobulin light chain junction region [Mus musculus]